MRLLHVQLGLGAVPDAEIKQVQSIFEYYDSDGNGCMDGPEFTKMAAELAQKREGLSGRQVFREIDADGSGYVEVRSRKFEVLALGL